MPFNIIRDDITRLETDAIVNAANSKLLAGSGVCGAIFSAAGVDELQNECDSIGYCGVGEAVITKGYNLKAKHVIHTVGPIYGQDPANEEKQLYSCYKTSLELAKKKNLNSIAFPVISSGIYGYPKAEAIKIATTAIKDFLLENDMDVYLVVYDQKTFQISEKLFNDVQSYIDERLVKPDARRRVAEDSAVRESYNMFPPQQAMYNACIEERMEAPRMCPSVTIGSADAKELRKKKSLEDLMNVKVETFSEMLLRMIDEKGMTDVEVYKRANIDRKLFSKIRKRDYTPRKTTVIALAIGLKY